MQQQFTAGSQHEQLTREVLDDLAALKEYLGANYRKARAPSTAARPPTEEQQRQQPDPNVASTSQPRQRQQQQQQPRTTAAGTTTNTSTAIQQQATLPYIPRPASLEQAASQALACNQSLKERLKRLLISVRRAQDKNAQVRQRVKECVSRRQSANAPLAAATATPIALGNPAAGSWFWTVPGAAPPQPNADIQDVAAVIQYLPLAFRRSPWTEEERTKLAQGVLQLVQEKQLNVILTELERRVAEGGAVSMEEFQTHQAPIKELTAASEAVATAAASFTDLDWSTIAHRTLPGRSGIDCKLQWMNAAKPGMRHDPFTVEEDSKLKELVAEVGEHDWKAVAAGFEGTRSSIQCLGRWQQMLKKGDVKSFTDPDYERLGELLKQHGKQWKRIAEEFGGGWSAKQLLHIWRKYEQQRDHAAVPPKKGKWSAEEDELLRKAVALKGRKWSEIAKFVPGRSDVQCRERYTGVLDPSIINDPWTEEEESKILELVPLNTEPSGKVRWAKVAAELPGRTDDHCRKMWQKLQREATGRQRDAEKAKKKAKKAQKRKKKEEAAAAKAAKAGKQTMDDDDDDEIISSEDNNDDDDIELEQEDEDEEGADGAGTSRRGATTSSRRRPRKPPTTASSDGGGVAGSSKKKAAGRKKKEAAAASGTQQQQVAQSEAEELPTTRSGRERHAPKRLME